MMHNPINITYCFPTAILSKMDLQLAEEILPLAKKYLTDPKEILRYKSTYTPGSSGSGLEHYADMIPFANYICDLGMQFMLKQGYSKSGFPNGFKPMIFASEMVKGDYHDAHAHPNSTLSGIIYLQVPEGSSPIVFRDPKARAKFLSYPVTTPMESNLHALEVKPKKGMILIWESWLEHEVPDSNTNTEEGRITLVFNLARA